MYIFAEMSPIYFQDTQSKSHSPVTIYPTPTSPRHYSPQTSFHSGYTVTLAGPCTCQLSHYCGASAHTLLSWNVPVLHIHTSIIPSGLCSSETQWALSTPWPPYLKLPLLQKVRYFYQFSFLAISLVSTVVPGNTGDT